MCIRALQEKKREDEKLIKKEGDILIIAEKKGVKVLLKMLLLFQFLSFIFIVLMKAREFQQVDRYSSMNNCVMNCRN